jgi:hypothetical protein
MSLMIDRLISELAAEDMGIIRKMKKADIIALTEALLKENLRELHDESIIEMYEEKFDTHLARA